MRFKKRDIKLAIFDLDGTLISSTDVWEGVDVKFFSKRGKTVPENYQKEIAHVGLKEAARITVEKYCPNEDMEAIIYEWKMMVIDEYANEIPLKDGAKDVLDLLVSQKVHLALATANDKELYEPCLKRLGIFDLFEFIIDVRSTKKGKSSSEIYDKVTDNFHLSRNEVMVIEDLPEALKTAHNAGYLTIGVYDEVTSKSDEYMNEISDLFIKDYQSLIEMIKEENN